MNDAREKKPNRHVVTAALIVAGMLLMSSTGSIAIAQETRSDSQPAAAVRAQAAPSHDSGSSEATGLRSNLGDLPFTGLDLLILAGLAMVLLGTGMALRRLSAPRVH